MNKVIIDYTRDNGLIAVLTYTNTDEKGIISGKEFNDLLGRLNNHKITKYNVVDRDLLLYYDGFVVWIKNYEPILELRKMKSYKDYVRSSVEKINIQRAARGKHLRAKRTSKVGKTLVTSGLLASIIITSALAYQSFNVSAKTEPTIDDGEQVISVYDSSEQDIYTVDDNTVNIKVEPTNTPEVSPTPETSASPEVAPTLVSNSNVKKETKTAIDINMSFEDRTDASKAISCKENYEQEISNVAETYGIDPQIMLAIATQERGEHSSTIDEGGGIGLMQIQYSVWVNNSVTAFNYKTNQKETYKINDTNVRTLDGNIKISAMIFQNDLIAMHNNIPAALMAYNWGVNGAKNKIEAYASDIGKTYEEVITNYSDTNWLSYFGNGNMVYANLVLSYLNTKNDINIKTNNNGSIDSLTYHINNSYQKGLNMS